MDFDLRKPLGSFACFPPQLGDHGWMHMRRDVFAHAVQRVPSFVCEKL